VVAERALQLGSAAVIVAHNHPSGVTEPSLSDQAITQRLRDALALLDIRLLDHFVVGDGHPVSMAERGMV
jgi:DNA repair protein RadC